MNVEELEMQDKEIKLWNLAEMTGKIYGSNFKKFKKGKWENM